MASWYDPFGVTDMLNPNVKDPSKKAMPYLEQIPGATAPYYSPYISRGQTAFYQMSDEANKLKQGLPELQKQYGSLAGMGPEVQNQYLQLMKDPTAMMNQIGAGYQASPGYQYQVDQATNAANRAGAAGGMLGSPEEQAYLAKDVSGLANQDYYNYLNQALGQYGIGLQGSTNLYGLGLKGEQGLYDTGLGLMGDVSKYGYGASNEYANMLANNLASMANLQYAGSANQNTAKSGMYGGLMGLGGAALMSPWLFA